MDTESRNLLMTFKDVANRYYDYLETGCSSFPLRFVSFDDFEASKQDHIWSEYQSEGTRSIKSNLNHYIQSVYKLYLLEKIISTSNYDEQTEIDLRLEFTVMPLHHCLLKPYEYAEQVRHYTTHISHQANRIIHSKKDKLLDDSSLKLTDLEEELKKWPSHNILIEHLKNLTNRESEFSKVTHNYRNRSQHGYPRSLEIGLTRCVERKKIRVGARGVGFKRFIQNLYMNPTIPTSRSLINKNGELNDLYELVVYSFGSEPPIQTSEILPYLIKEGELMVATHDAYMDLIRDQNESIISKLESYKS